MDTPQLPEFTLAEVEKWPIKMGHCLFLTHGLMGSFPAIFAGKHGKDAREVVMFDKESLIRKVWPLMTRRRAHISSQTFYVNEELGVAFPTNNAEYMIEHARPEPIPPIQFLNTEELDRVIAANPQPFEWAPGLISDDMNEDEFRQTLESAAREAGIELQSSLSQSPTVSELEAADFQCA